MVIQLPGMDGLALTSGCAGYITKPIDTRGLAGAVAGFLLAVAPGNGATGV